MTDRLTSDHTSDHTSIWAAIPVKHLSACKQRLAPLLTPTQRADLVLAMLADVLTTLARTPGLAGMLVISTDADVLSLAATLGAEPARQPDEIGFAPSANAAARLLPGIGALLAIPADLPGITPADIAGLLAAHPSTPHACTLVPSWDGTGSNAVLLTPPTAMPFQFGPDSRHHHQAAARAARLTVRLHHNPNLAADIDTPADLTRLATQPAGLHTTAFLQRTRLHIPAPQAVPA